ncbi:histone-like nucleoid-structuring protein Lsr2 [Kitasatospora indigofera]|uniref:Lsr2 family DNA-binding protein n=1 Tax=Kitasatospora indigofera TaxID=67307 RepID=UPI0036305C31
MPTDTADPATVLVAAESIDLSPTTPRQDADAAAQIARGARDEDDLVLLLEALGLPRDEDDIARLLPLSTTSAGTASGLPNSSCGGNPVSDTTTPTTEATEQDDILATLDPMTREVALSMRARGDSLLKILAATGLDESELQKLTAEHQGAAEQSPYGDVDDLLAWGQQHAQPRVQRLADQARQALDKLSAQRESDRAVAAYESRVTTLKAQLQRAEQALRDAKAGKPTAAPARSSGAAAGGELAQPADKAVRHAIRAWAAGQGHQVADRGVIPQTVLRAWHAAHPDTLRQAG